MTSSHSHAALGCALGWWCFELKAKIRIQIQSKWGYWSLSGTMIITPLASPFPQKQRITFNSLEPSVGRWRQQKQSLVCSSHCDCEDQLQTVEHKITRCPKHQPPNGDHGHIDLDDWTPDWFASTELTHTFLFWHTPEKWLLNPSSLQSSAILKSYWLWPWSHVAIFYNSDS